MVGCGDGGCIGEGANEGGEGGAYFGYYVSLLDLLCFGLEVDGIDGMKGKTHRRLAPDLTSLFTSICLRASLHPQPPQRRPLLRSKGNAQITSVPPRPYSPRLSSPVPLRSPPCVLALARVGGHHDLEVAIARGRIKEVLARVSVEGRGIIWKETGKGKAPKRSSGDSSISGY